MRTICLALLAMLLGNAAFGEYSERALALYVETQSKVAVGHTNFTAPPPPTRFAFLVAEAAQSANAAPAGLFETPASMANATALQFGGDAASATAMIQSMASLANSPLGPLTQIQGSSQISSLAAEAHQNIQLLALAMEKSGGNANFFLTVSAKGAIQAWNNLVNGVMDKMESVYREPAPNVTQWESMRNFLMDPQTLAFRGVLAGFSEKKAAQ